MLLQQHTGGKILDSDDQNNYEQRIDFINL